MAAPDFPASPSIGQTYTASSGVIYTWDGAVWATSSGVAAAYWTDTGTALTPTTATRQLVVPGPSLIGTTGDVFVFSNRTVKARLNTNMSPAANDCVRFNLNLNRSAATATADDNSMSTWELAFRCGSSDDFRILRTPVGSPTAPNILLTVDAAGKTTCTLADGTVNRAMLAAGAATGTVATASVPASFVTTVYNNWVDVVTLSITTRGGLVVLSVHGSMSYNTLNSTQVNVHQRLLRDSSVGAGGVQPGNKVGLASGVMALPSFVVMDQPAAGAHTYNYQVYQGTGASSSLTALGTANAIFSAVEIS